MNGAAAAAPPPAATQPRAAPASWPTTRPPDPAFVPPEPYPTRPPSVEGDTFWYGTNGFEPSMGAFMLLGLELPTAGCWELTGHDHGQSLRLVVRVLRWQP